MKYWIPLIIRKLVFTFFFFPLQILLDVVSVFNTVSSFSQKKHSVKINQEGIEVSLTLKICIYIESCLLNIEYWCRFTGSSIQ